MPSFNTIAAIVRDDVCTAAIRLGQSGKTYTYLMPLSLAETLEKDDYVVVESATRSSGLNVGQIVSWNPDVNLDPNDEIDYVWAFQKIDLSLLHNEKEVQNAIIDKLENRRQMSVREQALAALGITDTQRFLEDIKAK